MRDCLAGDAGIGNPSSSTHYFGKVAADLIEQARREIAAFISADPRELTVRGLQSDFRVDRAHAARVQSTALACFEAVAGSWFLDGSAPNPDWRALLLTAAALHEVGLAVGPRGHQRHAAYLLRHADMPGFSRREQDALTGLVRSHRQIGRAHV